MTTTSSMLGLELWVHGQEGRMEGTIKLRGTKANHGWMLELYLTKYNISDFEKI